ncbi:hypothetical protein [Hydrogenimonas urashimensis]|uniref:hypothetical protein n=1 Tax=Hydrogenimonas urashimensis TaxID=2740515 RepID=UPI001915EF49|nr:hypothetical protein [Hydrogenimonas urashimensis]
MYIVFTTTPYHYERLRQTFPDPSGIERDGHKVRVMYLFEGLRLSDQQVMQVGLIKKSIETLTDGSARFETKAFANDGPVYRVNDFFRRYCLYRSWPEWYWPRHRKQLMRWASRYAQRLYEKGLFCFETVLGYMMAANKSMKGKIDDYEKLEQKARWVYAVTMKRIEAGDFDKADPETLKQIRKEAGKKGNAQSQRTRKSKAAERRERLQQLINDGTADPKLLAAMLKVNERTVYRDLQKLGVRQ